MELQPIQNPIEIAALRDFERTMEEEVIPEIERVMLERAALAVKSKHWIVL